MEKTMQNIILDLCGGTGAWSKPWKDAGYDVKVITLPDWDIVLTGSLNNELVFYSPNKKKHMDIQMSDVYGILAAPPCTEFSKAKGNLPRDFEGAMHIVSTCMWIVWKCRTFGNLKFWALENPVGFLRQFLGKPPFVFWQWQYGSDFMKRTDLWGYFNEPKPTVKVKPPYLMEGKDLSHGRAWGNPKVPAGYENLGLSRAAIRAITPAGFATAFYQANKKRGASNSSQG